MTRILLALACGLALNIAEAQSTLYTNARIVTLAGAPIDKGNLLVTDGKIAAVGADVSAPAGAAVVDLAGAEIYPAFITANTVLGLVEVEAVRATVDTAEIGTVNPNARAQVAVNPDSDLLPVARANGVLYAHVVPQVSQPGLIAGSSALMQLKGWTWEDMTVQSGMGMHLFALPQWMTLGKRFPALQGHSGLSGTMAYYSPEHQLFIAGTVNQIAYPDQSFRLALKLVAEVLKP